MAANTRPSSTGPVLQLKLFEGLHEQVAPNRVGRKSAGQTLTSASQPSSPSVAPQHQFEWPFPKARQAAGKFVRDAIHEGIKDAAKKVVVTAIFATGATAVGHFQFDIFGWKATAEPPKMIKPWETTVKPAERQGSLRR